MPRTALIQTNFTAGEISPLMQGRVDIAKYGNGTAQLKNFVVRPQGPAWRRSGSKFVGEVKTSAKKTIIREFVFNSSQEYVLEFGDLYVRFWFNGGFVETAPLSGIPLEVVTPYLEADLAGLNFAQSGDKLYISHPSYQTRILQRTGANAWNISLFTTLDGPYIAGRPTPALLRMDTYAGTATITSSSAAFSSAAVGYYVEYRTDNDWSLGLITAYTSPTVVTVLPIPLIKLNAPTTAAYDYFPPDAKLQATNSGVWSTEDRGFHFRCLYVNDSLGTRVTGWFYLGDLFNDTVIFANQLPMVAYDHSAITMTLSNLVRTVKVVSDTAIFASTDVGRQMRLNIAGKQPWGTISVYTNSKQVTLSVGSDDLPMDPATLLVGGLTQIYRLGAWSITTGWPKVVAFHEQRLTFAGSPTEPQNLWMSQSSDYTNFAPSDYDSVVTDACAITYVLVSNRANPILWIQTGPTMLVGTLGGEFQVKAATLGAPLSPTNIMALPQTNNGSLDNVGPIKSGYAVLFIQKAGRKLLELTYEFTLDSYVGKDLTVLSEHILRTGGKVAKVAYQQEPISTVWACLTDGSLVSLVYERDQQVHAWTPHALGGTAWVESICSVSSAAGTEDLLYMVVKRTINGSTKRYIEYITPDFFPATPQDKAAMWFLDCALQYIGSPAVNITGLNHLNGETVSIVADGAVLPDQVVASNKVVLAVAASNVVVGYPFTSTMKTLPLEGGSPAGTAQGKIKKVDRLCLRLFNTLGYKYGSDLNSLIYGESYRHITVDPMDSSPPFFTGDQVVTLPMEFNKTGQFYIVQDQPYPLILLAIMPQTGVYD